MAAPSIFVPIHSPESDKFEGNPNLVDICERCCCGSRQNVICFSSTEWFPSCIGLLRKSYVKYHFLHEFCKGILNYQNYLYICNKFAFVSIPGPLLS